MTPEESLPMHRPVPEGSIVVWTIYDHPADYRIGFVLRATFTMSDGTMQADAIAWYAATADELRAIVPPGKTMLARHPNDDPVILETWI